MSKGLRQGDPLSPYLFNIAMEGLNIVMKEVISKGIFKGKLIPNTNKVVSYLFYADDAFFLDEWSMRKIANLARILRCFHVASSLKVNFDKSRVFGVGANTNEVESWALPLGCESVSLPFTYLGVPMGANMNFKRSWKLIIEKIKSKLSLWKAKILSFGGRITLAKSVLGNLPNFFLSIFLAPIGVVEEIDKIRRCFIWQGSQNNRSITGFTGKKILAPRDVGGQGLGSIRALNLSLMAKWIWRIKTYQNSLWAQVISGLHKLNQNCSESISNRALNGVWWNISKSIQELGN